MIKSYLGVLGGPRVTSPGSTASSWHLFSGPVGRSVVVVVVVVVAATAAAAAAGGAAVVVVARRGVSYLIQSQGDRRAVMSCPMPAITVYEPGDAKIESGRAPQSQ